MKIFQENILKLSTQSKRQAANLSFYFNFDLINKVQQTRNNCIIHSTTTLQLYTQTDYDIISLYKNDEILAQCVAITDWDTIEVLDCFCLEEETAEIVAKKISEEFKKDVNLKYFPDSLSAIPSTIEMIKPLKNIELPNEIFMSLNLDTQKNKKEKSF